MLFGHGLMGGQVSALRLPDTDPGLPPASHDVPTKGERLPLLQANEECLKVSIPENWELGLYGVRVETRSGVELPLFVNRAQLWWALGEQGATTRPGGEVRVFGKNLRLGSREATWRGQAVLRDGRGKFHHLRAVAINQYTLTFRVPEEVPEGRVAVFVHNGWGGAAGWSTSISLDVAPIKPWPEAVFNVRDFGAQGDAIHDDTPAIRAALNKCKENGGGVVFLPRGIYRISGQLTLPRKTVLRGEKREVVWLFVPMEIPQFNTVLAGEGEFGVEDLSMVGQTPWRMITAPDVESMYRAYQPWGEPGTASAHDIFLRRLRVHHLRYAHRIGTVKEDARRAEVSGPSTVALAGQRLELSDCEIVSPGMPIIIHGTKHTRVLRNILHTGRNGWYGFWGATETVIEGNVIEGQDLEASYGGLASYGKGSGTDVSRLYIADNRFLNGFGGEREALTFDTPGRYPWVGRVREGGSTSLAGEGVNWEKNDFVGLACLIVAGKGLGQHRRIMANDASQLTLDAPWDVVPDSTSVASIRPFRRDVVIYHNHSQDTSVGVQLWSGGYNFIIDNNTTLRTGGLWGTAAQYIEDGSHCFLPCYFTQWLENEISEGFIYQQGPEVDCSATLGLYVRDVPTGPLAGVLVLGNVFRGNQVRDNTRIGLFSHYDYVPLKAGEQSRGPVRDRPPIGRDTIIEDNSVSDSPIGIELGPGFEGTILRGNRFERVALPVKATRTPGFQNK